MSNFNNDVICISFFSFLIFFLSFSNKFHCFLFFRFGKNFMFIQMLPFFIQRRTRRLIVRFVVEFQSNWWFWVGLISNFHTIFKLNRYVHISSVSKRISPHNFCFLPLRKQLNQHDGFTLICIVQFFNWRTCKRRTQQKP